MKRLCILALALLLALSLAACGGKQTEAAPAPAASGTEAPASSEAASPEGPAPDAPVAEAGSEFVFLYRGCALPMNAEFAPLLEFIGEPANYFEAESCAFEGLDKTYTYDDVEILTYPVDGVDYISSIRLLTDGAATPEGITIGSTPEDVVAAYGEDYTVLGEQYTYENGDALLSVLFQNDAAISVEYIALNNLFA